jgi:hypothetical protein
MQGVLLYLFTTQMFQGPSVITLSIAATRMYRSLTDFDPSTSATVVYDSSLLSRSSLTTISNSKAPKLGWIQTPFNKIHVTVDTCHEQDQTSQMAHHDPCILSTKSQSCDLDKPNEHEPQQQSGECIEGV